MSIYQIAGGIAFVLLGIQNIWPMPHPMPIVTGVVCIVAGVALLIGR